MEVSSYLNGSTTGTFEPLRTRGNTTFGKENISNGKFINIETAFSDDGTESIGSKLISSPLNPFSWTIPFYFYLLFLCYLNNK